MHQRRGRKITQGIAPDIAESMHLIRNHENSWIPAALLEMHPE
jgi:hypothetical protein